MGKNNEFVAAIDIGTTKIVAIVGRKLEKNKLEIVGMSKTDSKGVKRGVVLNIEETVNAIQYTVNEVEKLTGIVISEAFVGIAGQHIKSIKHRGYIHRDHYEDEITKDDILALINDSYKLPIEAGEEIIHVLPQSFIVDNESGIKNPIGMSGKRLEANFHIVIGQIASAKNIEKCVNKVGLNVKSLILEPLASAEAVLTEDEKEAGVTLVDIGGGTTDIAVFFDGIVRHTAVIPFGGNVVTSDIKEGCSILQRQAESLKIQFGSALGDIAQEDKVVTIPGISGREPKEISFKSLAYIIQSRMEEILDAVMFEIENSGYIDKLAAGMVVTGGGALLKHLPQLVRYKTGMDVRVGFPNEHLSGANIKEVNQPMFATSVGLIMKGFSFLADNNSFDDKDIEQPKKTDEIELEVEEESTVRSKSLINSIKDVFSNIFDEKDSVM